MRNKQFFIIAGAVLVISIVGIYFTMSAGLQPYARLNADEILSFELRVQPPNTTRIVTDRAAIAELAEILNEVRVHNKSDEWREMSGQYVEFTLSLDSGETLSIAAYNPHIIINGQGYTTNYEPCQRLNALGNRLFG